MSSVALPLQIQKPKVRIPQADFVRDSRQRGMYVTFKLVRKYHSSEQAENFERWMIGQTYITDGEELLYSSDYERWLEQQF